MTDFKVSSKTVSGSEALAYANDLEKAIGEIVSGERKSSKIPLDPIVALIQFARDAEKQNAELLAALKELVELKQIHDTFKGLPLLSRAPDWRTEQDAYMKRKPIAWKRAAELVQPSTNQEVSRPRLIPDSECKQGKCACTTTGCWGKCSLVISENQEVSE